MSTEAKLNLALDKIQWLECRIDMLEKIYIEITRALDEPTQVRLRIEKFENNLAELKKGR